MENRTYIGIEIGGSKLQVVAADANAAIAERRRVAVDPSKGAQHIRDHIERLVVELSARGTPAGIGVGFGGPINIDTGQVALSYHVEGWADFQMKSWLRDLCDAPVNVDNDANTAALAEALRGGGRGFSRVFYVTLGSGMGGGMVMDGNVYHGARPGESEVGQMCFDPSGATVESHCCGWAVDRKIREYVGTHPGSQLAGMVGNSVRGEAVHLLPAMHAGDPGARAIFEEVTSDLAFGLSFPSHLFHPEVIIIGGGLSLMGEPLRQAVADRLPALMTAALKPGPAVKLAELGEDVVCVGALLLAQQAAEPGAHSGHS